MIIEWLGHSCFLFTTNQGTRIITDPFDEKVGYPLPRLQADIVTVSHHHFDHDSVHLLSGQPQIFEGVGTHVVRDVTLRGISAFHDHEQGEKRGLNTIFTFDIEGLHLAHLGDLGHPLDEERFQLLGRIDILFLPVGGFYTIDVTEAAEIVSQINPRIAIPMHYKYNDSIQLPIANIQGFLKSFPSSKQFRSLEVSTSILPPSTETIVLELKSLA